MTTVLHNVDCMEFMKGMSDKSVDFVLTDIPYAEVSEHETREGTGIRNLNKAGADIITFNLEDFMNEIARIARNGCVVFCGIKQISDIYIYIYRNITVQAGCWYGKKAIHHR